MKKIETKIAKNGTKMYYVDGKRVNREIANQTAAENREEPFAVEYRGYDSKLGRIADKTLTNDKMRVYVRQEAGRYDIKFYIVINGENVNCFFGRKACSWLVRDAKKAANDFAGKILEAYINGAAGVKLVADEVIVITGEADPDDYAVNTDALEVAVDAEIELANAEANEIEEKPQEETKMKKTIETKIAKNGTKMYYVDGKRVNREVAEEIESKQAIERRNNLVENTFTEYEKKSSALVVTAGYQANIVICFDGYLDFTYTRNYSTCEDAINAVNFFKTNFYHGSDGKFETGNVTREVEAECNGIAYSHFLHYYMINAADSEGQFLKDFESPTEANPDDYAVSQEALEVATNAEIEAMKVAREERIKAAQKEVADYIAKIDEQEKQEKVAAFERELAEYYAERELANSEHTPEYKYYIKSRRPIAGAVPKGYISATAGEMKAYSFGTDGSISRVPRKVVFGVVSYDHPLSDEQIINYDLHVDPRNPNPIIKGSDKEETQMTKQAEFYADKIARDAKPCDDNDVEIDEASPANTLVADIEEDDVEELNPIVETKITKRSLDSVSLKLNGKRISLRNLEDALDAPRTNFAVINEYGKKYDCRRCSKDYYGFFGTSPEEYTIHFNTLGELVKHYAFDNIVRDTASETPVDSKFNPPEPPKPTDKEPYRPFTPKEEVDIINHNINWAKGILATMQGDTYTDNIGETFTRNQLETAIIDWQDEIADLQPQADKTAEPPKPVELVAPTVMGALETINAMFPLDGFVEDVSKPNFKSAINGDWRLNIFIDKNGTPEAVSLAEDDQLFLTVKIKARSLRDSINRAIKTCVKNRIAYRKNHNAEMEKYEYELMHLLQAARRELEVA